MHRQNCGDKQKVALHQGVGRTQNSAFSCHFNTKQFEKVKINYGVPEVTCFGFHNVRRTNSFTSGSNSESSLRQGARLATERNLAQPLIGRGLQENLVARVRRNSDTLTYITRSHYRFSWRAVLPTLALIAASVWSGLFRFGSHVNEPFKAYSFRKIP